MRGSLKSMLVVVVLLSILSACVPITPMTSGDKTLRSETPSLLESGHESGPSPAAVASSTQPPTPVATREQEKEHVVEMTPTTIRQGDQWPVRGERLLALITGPQSWHTFLKQHHADKLPWPDIDWDRQVVLVALMGAKRTGGYRITLRHVTVRGKEVQVTVEERSPRPGEMVIQVLTSPFHVVTIPRDDLPSGPFTLVFQGEKGQRWQVLVSSLNEDALYIAQPTFTLPQKEGETPTK